MHNGHTLIHQSVLVLFNILSDSTTDTTAIRLRGTSTSPINHCRQQQQHLKTDVTHDTSTVQRTKFKKHGNKCYVPCSAQSVVLWQHRTMQKR